MNNRHHHHKRELDRERERQIEHMNRQMEERKRELERHVKDIRRQIEDPIPSPEHPTWLLEEESGGGPGSDFQAQQPELGPALSPRLGTMSIDLLDQEEEFVLTVAVPGFSPDEIDVSLVDDVLQIEATQEESEEQEEEGRYLMRERHQSMSRSVALGTPIAEDEEISAHYENGVVTIRLPKAEPVEDESVRQIDIE